MTDTIPGNTTSTQSLAIGTSAFSAIDFLGDTDWWKATLTYGYQYQVWIEGSTKSPGTLVDPYLGVYSGAGTFAFGNDDASFLSFYSYATVIPSSDGYVFLSAEENGNNATGSYTITIWQDELASTASAATVPVNSVSGVGHLGWQGDTSDWYAVTLTAGVQYQFDLIGSAGDGAFTGLTLVDPWLALRSSTGAALLVDDDSGLGFNSRLFFTPSVSGTYYLDAEESGSNAFGTYRLLVNSTPIAGAAVLGTAIAGAIDFVGDADLYSVSLTAGVSYAFAVSGTTLADPYLEVLDNAGAVVSFDDDSGSGLDAYVTYTPATSGTYYLAARESGNNATGGYSARVWQLPTVSIANASVLEGNSGTTNLVFTLTLSAVSPIDVSVTVATYGTATATYSNDYTPALDTVTIAAGQTSATFTVQVLGDLIFESTESLHVRLSSPANAVLGDSDAYGYIFDNDNPYALPSDSLVGYQWYLYPTTGINAFPVWADYTGAGVRVAVFDQGIDPSHPDLDGNLLTSLGRNASNLSAGGSPILPTDNHGTAVAGTIAAERNGSGIVGVAYSANLVAIYSPLPLNGLSSQIANAYSYATNFDVLNDSWGFANGFSSGQTWAFFDNFSGTSFSAAGAALANLGASGRHGLGTVVVQSAGNSFSVGDDTNLHNFQNSQYIVTVAATDYFGNVTAYSSPGASVLIAAPGGGGTDTLSDIFTTDRVGAAGTDSSDYASTQGTSFSAPIVSGIVALMLEANPSLGYRDVQEILAYSARKIDTTSNDWRYNGTSNWNGGGLHYDALWHRWGYGLVDALAAVRLAETWGTTAHTASNREQITATHSVSKAIPDGGGINFVASASDAISVAQSIDVERVEVTLNVTHPFIGDLSVWLTSPSGTRSFLLWRPQQNALSPYGTSQNDIHFTFDTVLDWGESSVGSWGLAIYDNAYGYVGTFDSWTLNLIGKPASTDDVYIYTNEFAEATADQAARSTLTDTGGTDTLNAAACSSDLVLNLAAGGVSTIDGRSLTIAVGTVIENAYGGDGNDAITGNGAANVLNGMRGNDTLVGGDGIDTAVFSGARSEYALAPTSTGWTLTGPDGSDTLATIEFARFTDQTLSLGNFAPTGSVTITGAATQGQILTAANSLADVDGMGSVGYQWNADGIVIGGATANTYNLTQSEVGKVITVSAHYTDGHGNAESVTSSQTGAVANVNDAPVITSGNTGAVPENAATSTVVYTVASSDVDASDTVSYSLSGTDAAAFSIDSAGAVRLNAAADYETKASYSINVLATDRAGLSAAKAITVAVTNVNEAPTVTSGSTGAVAENAATSTVVYTVASSDVDTNDTVSFSLSGTDAAAFSVDSAGAVRLNAAADFEIKASYSINLLATDRAGLSATEAVTVAVTNVNEVPVITSGGTGAVTERDPTSTVVYTVVSSDVDASDTVSYSLSGTDAAAFSVDSVGAVRLNASADYAVKSSYSINVLATDRAGLSASKAVTVAVTLVGNVNSAPVITSGSTGAVTENAATSTVVYTVASSDVDASDTVSYSLSGTDAAAFSVDSAGAVRLNAASDFETKASYTINALATDRAGLSATKAVTVAVTNVNEGPSITSGSTGAVAENAATSTVVYTVASSDVDANDTVSYSLSGTDAAAFSIDSAGAVRLCAAADFETKASYSVNVMATDRAGLSATKAITVAVTNVNEAPIVTSGSTGAVTENAATSTVVYTVASSDVDASDTVSYSLSGTDAAAFSVDSAGAVRLNAAADFETKASYTINVLATDRAGLSATKAVTVGVTNLDEVAPNITSSTTATAINENSGAGQVVYTATSTDTGDTVTGSTSYSLKTGSDAGLSIDASTGTVTLAGNPNYETKSSYAFTVVATDAANNTAEKAVTLAINNLDEVAPNITSSSTPTTINENSGTGQVIYITTSTDSGDIATGLTVYGLKAGSDAGLSISASTGAVTLATNPNYETKSSYSFTVVATDAANNATEKAVTLAIGNVNDAPVISSGINAVVLENAATSTVVYTAIASDEDTSDTLSFSLSGTDADFFDIVGSTGVLTLKASADFETKASYAITVVATDNGAGSLSATKAVTVVVTNVNEAPDITSGSTGVVVENAATSTVVYTVASSDVDANDTVSYSLSGTDAAAFSIDSAGAVRLNAAANFETKASYSINVQATDRAGLSSTKAVTVAVTNLDEVAPNITSSTTATAINENSGAGQVVYTVTSTDVGDTATGSTSYSLKALTGDVAALSINLSTGAVTLTGNPDYETKSSYSFTVVATDAASNAAEKAVTLAINNLDEVAPSVTSGATATAVNENSGAGQVVYTAASTDTGDTVTGSATYSLKALTGDVAVLSINVSTGAVTLTGNPDYEIKSSYSFTVVTTDAASNAAEKAVTLAINNLDEVAPTITSSAIATAVNENSGSGQVVYTATSTDAGDTATGSTSYSLKTGSDTGLSINASTGAVTLMGNPDYETKPSYSFTVVATDAANNPTEKAVTLAIGNVNDAPVISSAASAAVLENAATSTVVCNVVASDEDASDTLSFSLSGTDAGFFDIVGSTGVVTLKASADFETKASYTINVLTTDRAGLSATKAVTVAVTNLDEVAPNITSSTTATAISENSGTGQVVYTATSTDTGDTATGSTSYSLKTGSDAGLSINASNGAVTLAGNPNYETKSSYSFTVIATDAANNAAEKAVTLAIANLDEVAPTITSGAIATAINENSGSGQVVYTATSTDAGDTATGSTNYALKALTGDVAALSINLSTGAVTLTGNPDYETKSSYSFTVVAADAANNVAEKAVTLAISNVNDTPVISSGTSAVVLENAATSTVVYTATASDEDTSDTLSYSLSGTDAGFFDIVGSTGAVTLKASADFETKTSYSITVVATDDGTGNLSASKTVTVVVTNVDEYVTPEPDPVPVTTTTTTISSDGTQVTRAVTTNPDGSSVTEVVKVSKDGTAVTEKTAVAINGTKSVDLKQKIDGASVTETAITKSDGSTVNLFTVDPVPNNRQDTGGTANADRADIALYYGSSVKDVAATTVSLPVGVGLVATGVRTPTNNTDAVANLNTLLLQTTNSTEAEKALMFSGGQVFLSNLASTATHAPLIVNSIKLSQTTGGGVDVSHTITISGTTSAITLPSGSTGTPVEIMVIDTRDLPFGSALELQNIEFAVIIGNNITLRGGDGANIVYAGEGSQNMVLGADDDILHGGGGNDVVGSKGGNDQLFGDDGNDTVVGGLGDDHLEGGAGDDLLVGGQSDAGQLNFSQLKGQLTMNWTPNDTDLADSAGWSNTGNSDGGTPVDPRLAFMYQSTEMRETVTELYHLLLNKLPTVEEMNFWGTSGYSVAQLEQGAANMLLKYVLGLPTQYQVKFVMEQLWGVGKVTGAQIQSNTSLINAGGSWGQLVDALIKSDGFKTSLLNANGSMSLTQSSNMTDSGWSFDTGADTLFGGAGNDTLIGGRGNDLLDGGDGIDTATWFGQAANFEVQIIGSGASKDVALLDSFTGELDIIRNIEQLQIGGVNFDATRLASLSDVQAYLANHTDHHLQVVLVGLTG